MEVALVVFDMAGTTVYDGDAVNICLRSALEAAGAPTTRDAVNAVMGIAKPLAIRTLLTQQREGAAIAETEVDRIHADFLTRMLAYYREDPAVREVEGATDTFRTLRQAGVKVALDTGFSRPIVDVILERLGWQQLGLLDATVASDEVAQGRPHPDLIYRAMELTGVTEARRVAKVGDTPSDLQEGQAAGCGWIIGVTEGSHTAQQLREYSYTHLIPTITALTSFLLPPNPK
jgi:phosphonatase-like hydrolase